MKYTSIKISLKLFSRGIIMGVPYHRFSAVGDLITRLNHLSRHKHILGKNCMFRKPT
ncbi:Uncharacterised protein [Salmonella enterica subsp. enterica serovar Typhi]|nr:Uncharacterised protein [Salmonella enterica subsp. enterica serovar Typhi]